ncbi:oligopeptide transport system substrate-binding protein [Enterococcus sp. AZ009]|uniref:peptide ABC transporter substrate-binding protein n=1 Tax=Enterococcus sp. AZ009 TaxID=2774766 RepID=UPI001C477BE4|nr:peptide ABC transporter substrate-binding protein [Enterococcus casseliflavus]
MKKKMMGITAFTLLVLSACSTTSPTTDSGQQEEQGAVAQEIQVSTAGALSTLDSGQYTDVNSSDMIGQVAEGLYRLDQEGDPELAMAAEEPTVSEDGLVYTFTIRDAKWSNGDPVTADDFVYAFQYVANPENGSSSSNQMDVLKNGSQVRQGDAEVSELGAKALDQQTLELTLASPISYLDQILVGTPFMPKNQAFAEEKGADYGLSAENFVGNGPFLIEGWNGTNESWTLTKNPDYWDAENVQLTKIDVQVVKETATGVSLFETGELDYTTLTDTYAQQYQNSAQANYVPKALVGYLSANQKREVTGNVKVRQAILQAIDKEAFAENILGDGSTALNGFVPSNFAKDPETDQDFREENGDLLPYDLTAAQELWAQAKEELGQEEITLELLSADTAAAKKTIEFVQGQLETNLPGLTIDAKSIPLQNRLDLQSQGEFDLVFGTWTPDYADPINFLEFYDSTGGLNTSGYASESYDQGLAEARTTLANDPAARWDLLKELEKQLIVEDTAVLPLYQGVVAYLKTDRLQGVQVFPFGRTVSYRLASVTE